MEQVGCVLWFGWGIWMGVDVYGVILKVVWYGVFSNVILGMFLLGWCWVEVGY